MEFKKLINTGIEKVKSNYKEGKFSPFFAILLAIGIGLLIGLIVMMFSNIGESIPAFFTLTFGGLTELGDVLYKSIPILMTGLSVGLAFKMKLFNIGAVGQYTMGMFFALVVGFYVELPTGLHTLVAIMAAFVGGALWGFIPGLLKAFFNVNEVIATIMLNYIGMYLVDMWIKGSGKMFDFAATRTKILPQSVQLMKIGSSTSLNIAIVIGILIAITLHIVLNKTKFGYELLATGFNKDASNYAGINYKKNTIITMALAGGIAGLGGAFAILAPSIIANNSMTYEPINVLANNGFMGIAVALLANSNPLGIIFSAFFVSYIQKGGSLVHGGFSYKPEIADVIISTIIYVSAFSVIISKSVGDFLKKRKERKANPSGSSDIKEE
ncbi:MAG: ABC transporter permease [Acholeplasma sp.]|nr:ABC transporter permease [Acholeplasma sp.]